MKNITSLCIRLNLVVRHYTSIKGLQFGEQPEIVFRVLNQNAGEFHEWY